MRRQDSFTGRHLQSWQMQFWWNSAEKIQSAGSGMVRALEDQSSSTAAIRKLAESCQRTNSSRSLEINQKIFSCLKSLYLRKTTEPVSFLFSHRFNSSMEYQEIAARKPLREREQGLGLPSREREPPLLHLTGSAHPRDLSLS